MTTIKHPFGQTKDGKQVDSYTLTDGEYSAEILTYGGAIRCLTIPTAKGPRDISLGFDDVAGYEGHTAFFGAIIGRVGNRIGKARFAIDGKEYNIGKNDGENSLHGGFHGFDKQVWDAKEYENALVFTLKDADGANGYPGSLDVEVCYSLKDGALSIEYRAESSMETPVNLTNHCYFNLGGHDFGSIEDHKLQVISEHITAIDETLITTGELMDVTGTPFDLRKPTLIGPGLQSGHPQIEFAGGYDHNYVLSHIPHRELSLAAVLEFDGVRMSCLTTKPGIQFYSGNFLSGEAGKKGAKHPKRSGLCLETQYWPDTVNKPEFPGPNLKKGDIYSHKTVYRFENV